ncbi:hypothetical protein VTN02DRAFT_4374 [Thermoascus thermophilus]
MLTSRCCLLFAYHNIEDGSCLLSPAHRKDMYIGDLILFICLIVCHVPTWEVHWSLMLSDKSLSYCHDSFDRSLACFAFATAVATESSKTKLELKISVSVIENHGPFTCPYYSFFQTKKRRYSMTGQKAWGFAPTPISNFRALKFQDVLPSFTRTSQKAMRAEGLTFE